MGRGFRARKVPDKTGEVPEAEIQAWIGVRRDMSDLVADFYHDRFMEQKSRPARLLIESFILLDPLWILSAGAIPDWTVFSTEASYRRALKYVDGKTFDEILITLFAHGVESVGLASIDDWQKLGESARSGFSRVGVDKNAYPQDFGVFFRYCHSLWSANHHIGPVLATPIPLSHLFSFFRTSAASQGERSGRAKSLTLEI